MTGAMNVLVGFRQISQYIIVTNYKLLFYLVFSAL